MCTILYLVRLMYSYQQSRYRTVPHCNSPSLLSLKNHIYLLKLLYPWKPIISFLKLCLDVIEMLYKWNHATFWIFFPFSTGLWNSVVAVIHNSIPFNGWIVFHFPHSPPERTPMLGLSQFYSTKLVWAFMDRFLYKHKISFMLDKQDAY